MTWLAITTEPRKQRIVRKRLRRKGYDAYLPCLVIRQTTIKANRASKRRRVMQLMPYIFVREPHKHMRELVLYDILSTRDVRGYVGSKVRGPDIVQEDAIDALRASIAGLRLDMDAARYKSSLRRGGKAIIKAGTLAGRKGTITWVHRQRARLETMVFGAMREVEVAVKDLEAA